eukprot:s2861_g15.t1
MINADQAIRSRRLFHLIQQGFSGYPRVENIIRSQIAFYGIQATNGFELLRLLRREFSLMSRPEALHYREAALKYTVKKADKHLLLDVLREVGPEALHYREAALKYTVKKADKHLLLDVLREVGAEREFSCDVGAFFDLQPDFLICV